jgi:hypothetical protein
VLNDAEQWQKIRNVNIIQLRKTLKMKSINSSTVIKYHILLLLFISCTKVNYPEEIYSNFQNGLYQFDNSTSDAINMQKIRINENYFNYLYNDSSVTSGKTVITMSGKYTYKSPIVYLMIENGDIDISMQFGKIIGSAIPEIKAACLYYNSDTIVYYGGAYVFRPDNNNQNEAWGKWKTSYALGSRLYDIPLGKVFKNIDSLVYLTLNNDSTWEFQTFDISGNNSIKRGRVKEIISTNDINPKTLNDSIFVYDRKENNLLAFWDCEATPIRMVKK